jgi:hypothetical protein
MAEDDLVYLVPRDPGPVKALLDDNTGQLPGHDALEASPESSYRCTAGTYYVGFFHLSLHDYELFKTSDLYAGGINSLALDETPDGAVIGAFNLRREVTGRQFPHATMVFQALTAVSLARTRLVSTVAALHVSLIVLTVLSHTLLLG